MAPFKLRFSRSGGSRSASTEVETEAEPSIEITQEQLAQGAGTQAELRTLLPGSNNDNRLDLVLGYSNPMEISPESCRVPSSPPPSYEYVLNETRLAASLSEKGAPVTTEPLLGEKDLNNFNSNLYVSLNEQDEEQYAEINDKEEAEYIDKKDPLEDEASCPAPPKPVRKPEEIFHKSSKELYRAVAKQWGITCKVSDHCRCLDCQSHYFDCDYDQNENEKTDGGLSAGTPMLIHEVMHGSGCVIL